MKIIELIEEEEFQVTYSFHYSENKPLEDLLEDSKELIKAYLPFFSKFKEIIMYDSQTFDIPVLFFVKDKYEVINKSEELEKTHIIKYTMIDESGL